MTLMIHTHKSQRNSAFHQHNIFTFISESTHFSSVMYIYCWLRVLHMSYCKQKGGQMVISPPTARVGHLVFTVGEYADQVAWNATFSGRGLIDAMNWHGVADGPELPHKNSAAITHQALCDDIVKLMDMLPHDAIPKHILPKSIQRLYEQDKED